MKIIVIQLLCIASALITNAQSIDYNTNKGYVAEGYDLVSYFENKPVKGSKDYKLTYDHVDFLFATEENLKTFKDNPEIFIPAYGGYCAYAIAVNSKKVKIDPKTYDIRDGKLYLFYNSWGNNTLESWLKEDVKGLQEKADKNWEAIKLEH